MWDSSGSGCVRYSAADAGERMMGHVVENDVLQAALLGQLRRPRAATELLWPARPHGHLLMHHMLLCVSRAHSSYLGVIAQLCMQHAHVMRVVFTVPWPAQPCV